VSPELRADAEAVLAPGESLSASARNRPVDPQAVVSRDRVRLTLEALGDLQRLPAFPIEKDPAAAARAVDAIETSFELLEYSPFSCRKAWPGDRPLLRELVIPFGSAGYVALFEIDGPSQVSILAVRHQREEDYH
jgi:plasmid stabilization system protein ParE